MRVRALSVPGCWMVEPDERPDALGAESWVFRDQELRAHGLDARVAEISTVRSTVAGTLRGLHVRHESNPACTLVRCTRGRTWDVVVDVRTGSPTWGRWEGVELDATRGSGLWVCEGVAHGTLARVDDVEQLILHNRPHASRAEQGLRWGDPAFGIAWPALPVALSARDRDWPLVARPAAALR